VREEAAEAGAAWQESSLNLDNKSPPFIFQNRHYVPLFKIQPCAVYQERF
jgi:hypothetical protein